MTLPGEMAIEVEHLTKVYKIFNRPSDRVREAFHPFRKRYSHDFYALKDLTFNVRKGENIGFIGRNGAGKSTLLKLITGVLTPTAGTIAVHGSVASLLELGAGFNPEMTGVENIYMNGAIMGRTRSQMDERLADIEAFADIGEFIYQPVKMYSSGMFARLAFAVNAFVEPDILIVDEALSVGDQHFQMKCMKKMRELMDGGTAVLFVSHDLNAIRRFCSRAFWLDHDVLRGQGETNAVVDSYTEFLKLGDEPRGEAGPGDAAGAKQPGKVLAEIKAVRFLDGAGQSVTEAAYDAKLAVEVEYEVLAEEVDHPVLGVALKSVDEVYVCGLNTLLDKVEIPWRLGRNVVRLSYPAGLRVLGGRYFVDIALFDETATVPIQYLERVREITVTADYPGEGEVILPHVWQVAE